LSVFCHWPPPNDRLQRDRSPLAVPTEPEQQRWGCGG
jgi:hypothetical protein